MRHRRRCASTIAVACRGFAAARAIASGGEAHRRRWRDPPAHVPPAIARARLHSAVLWRPRPDHRCCFALGSNCREEAADSGCGFTLSCRYWFVLLLGGWSAVGRGCWPCVLPLRATFCATCMMSGAFRGRRGCDWRCCLELLLTLFCGRRISDIDCDLSAKYVPLFVSWCMLVLAPGILLGALRLSVSSSMALPFGARICPNGSIYRGA